MKENKGNIISYQSVWTAVLVEMLSMPLLRWPQGGLAGLLSLANTCSSLPHTQTHSPSVSPILQIQETNNCHHSFSHNLCVAFRRNAESQHKPTDTGTHTAYSPKCYTVSQHNFNPIWVQVQVTKMLDPNILTIQVSQAWVSPDPENNSLLLVRG